MPTLCEKGTCLNQVVDQEDKKTIQKIVHTIEDLM